MAKCSCNSGAQAYDQGAYWHYLCPKCGARWRIPKGPGGKALRKKNEQKKDDPKKPGKK